MTSLIKYSIALALMVTISIKWGAHKNETPVQTEVSQVKSSAEAIETKVDEILAKQPIKKVAQLPVAAPAHRHVASIPARINIDAAVAVDPSNAPAHLAGYLRAEELKAPLFKDIKSKLATKPEAEPMTMRQRAVAFDKTAIEAAISAGKIELNLFDNANFKGVIESAIPSVDGGYIVHGYLEGVNGGTFDLVYEKETMIADISTSADTYEIRYSPAQVQVVKQIDTTKMQTEDPEGNLLPPPSEGDGGETAGDAASDAAVSATGSAAAANLTQIDVLVAYTASVLAAQGSVAAVNALAQNAIAKANLAYANSAIQQNLRLVGVVQLSGAETGTAGTDLRALWSTTDKKWDNVHSIRNQLGADLVTLLVNNMGDACGIGYLFTGNRTAGFNVTKTSCISGETMTHELGHNMGAQHNVEDAKSTPAYNYAYGYYDCAHSFRTVMSYNVCRTKRVNYFSNPNLTYNGFALGVASTNNALALNNTRVRVSNLTKAVAAPVVAPVAEAPAVTPAPTTTSAPTTTASTTPTTQTPAPKPPVKKTPTPTRTVSNIKERQGGRL